MNITIISGKNYYRPSILLPAFYIDYKDNGVIYNDNKYNLPFLLEYASSEAERELNGSIIGAIGLRSWYRATGDNEALDLYKKFIQCIVYRLPDYDYPMEELPEGTSWSKYSLTSYPATNGYHRLHLNLLSSLSRDKLIEDLDKFENIKYYLTKWKRGNKYKYPDENFDYLFKTDLDSILK